MPLAVQTELRPRAERQRREITLDQMVQPCFGVIVHHHLDVHDRLIAFVYEPHLPTLYALSLHLRFR